MPVSRPGITDRPGVTLDGSTALAGGRTSATEVIVPHCVIEVAPVLAGCATALALLLTAVTRFIERALPVLSDKAARRVAKMNRAKRN